jgi:hypothetical protein
MKIILSVAATTAVLTAAQTAYSQAVRPDGQPIDRTAERACQERIELVRAERGLPKLERGAASEQEPLFFTALDYEIEGCSALVMRHDTSEIRPVPMIPDNRPLFMRAR